MLKAKVLDLQAAVHPSDSHQGLGLLSCGHGIQVPSNSRQQGRCGGFQPVKHLGELSKLVRLTELWFRLASSAQMMMTMMMSWSSGR